MSGSPALLERSQATYHMIADDSEAYEAATLEAPRSAVARLDAWQHVDLVDKLIDELIDSGRIQQARAVRAALGLDEDEQLLRNAVTRQWAEDWDSDEDAAYDLL